MWQISALCFSVVAVSLNVYLTSFDTNAHIPAFVREFAIVVALIFAFFTVAIILWLRDSINKRELYIGSIETVLSNLTTENPVVSAVHLFDVNSRPLKNVLRLFDSLVIFLIVLLLTPYLLEYQQVLMSPVVILSTSVIIGILVILQYFRSRIHVLRNQSKLILCMLILASVIVFLAVLYLQMEGFPTDFAIIALIIGGTIFIRYTLSKQHMNLNLRIDFASRFTRLPIEKKKKPDSFSKSATIAALQVIFGSYWDDTDLGLWCRSGVDKKWNLRISSSKFFNDMDDRDFHFEKSLLFENQSTVSIDVDKSDLRDVAIAFGLDLHQASAIMLDAKQILGHPVLGANNEVEYIIIIRLLKDFDINNKIAVPVFAYLVETLKELEFIRNRYSHEDELGW
jgi:hypothetical protein